jgi:F-type H+-transporting ATPase subunit a
MQVDPLHQFQVYPIVPIKIGEVDLSFTNASLFMFLAVFLPLIFFRLAFWRKKKIPTRLQSTAEAFLQMIEQLAEDINSEKGRPFFPFIFSIFLFTFMGNMLGMFPFCFTFTSQLITNFGLAFLVLSVITIIGLMRNGVTFLRVFLPQGVPLWIAPLLIPVKVISYFLRPISLAIRLFVNMTAGHIMLKMFAYFTVSLGAWGIGLGALSLFPLAVNTALMAFEFLVAFLQAYVFTILSCIYLHDALYTH